MEYKMTNTKQSAYPAFEKLIDTVNHQMDIASYYDLMVPSLTAKTLIDEHQEMQAKIELLENELKIQDDANEVYQKQSARKDGVITELERIGDAVIILEDDAEPEIGDIVQFGDQNYGMYHEVEPQYKHNFKGIPILQRNGRPVIYKSQLEGK